MEHSTMIWAAKIYPLGEETDAEKTFRQLFAKHKQPKAMLLVSEKRGRKSRLLVGLPTEEMLPRFPGFERVSVGQFPSRASVSLRLGDREVFDRWFTRSGGSA